MDQIFHKEKHPALQATIYDPAKEKIDPKNSEHMNTIVSRQGIIANSPIDGIHKGREVALMRINRVCDLVECTYVEKAPRFSKAQFVRYFRAIKAKMNPYDKVFGALLGTFQATAMLGFASLPHFAVAAGIASPEYLESVRPIDWRLVGLAFGFGMTTTVIKSTFDNWRNLGAKGLLQYKTAAVDGSIDDLKTDPSRYSLRNLDIYRTLTSQTARRSTLSVAHRVGLILTTATSLAIDISFESLVSPGTIARVLTNTASIAANIIIGNYTSYWWEQPAHIRAELRMNKRPLFKGPPDETAFEAKKRFQLDLFEKQIRYNAVWLIAMADMLNIFTVDIPEIGPVSLLKFLMLSAAAIGRWRTVVAAEKKDYKDAAQMRADFENTWYMRLFRRMVTETEIGGYGLAYHKTFIQPKIDDTLKPVKAAAQRAKNLCNIHLGTDF
jgi:hypothetical protein